MGTDIHGKTIRVVTKVSKIKRMLGVGGEGGGLAIKMGSRLELVRV